MKICLIFIFIFFLLTGCSSKSELENTTTHSNNIVSENFSGYTLHSDITGASFYYPSSWTYFGNSQNPGYYSTDPSGLSINFIAQEIDNNISFEQFVENSIMQIKDTEVILGEIKKENINLNENSGYELSYIINKNDINISVIQILMNKDNLIYLFTLGGPTELFNNYDNEINFIISSFKI